jgi:hypothetical protein
MRAAQRQAVQAVRVAQGKIDRDSRSHRQADKVHLVDVERGKNPRQIIRKVAEFKRRIIIVTVTIPTAVPGKRGKMPCENRRVFPPIRLVSPPTPCRKKTTSPSPVRSIEMRGAGPIEGRGQFCHGAFHPNGPKRRRAAAGNQPHAARTDAQALRDR